MPDDLSTNGSFIAQRRTASKQIKTIRHKEMEEPMKMHQDPLERTD